MTVREPVLKPIPILDLRPTQITVGMREVSERRKRWRERSAKEMGKFLDQHMIPVVQGPKMRHYIIDHHHLVLALHKEGIEKILVNVVADLNRVEVELFWTVLDNRGWLHPFDAHGRRRDHTDIPKSIIGLIDDPFRSLAGELRRAGGFAKETTPFSEFLWADFLRQNIKTRVVRENFNHALETALELARSRQAEYLPGWCGAAPHD
jgi:hypothetical protein